MNLAIAFALGSAVFWGSGDFLGGLASRTASSIATTFMAQAAGLVGLLAVCLVTGPNPFDRTLQITDIGWGVVAGLSAVLGLGMFYEAMGRGPLGPVASVTSIVSSVVPVAAGLLLGERPSTRLLTGVGVAIVGIWLVAGQRRSDTEQAASGRTLALAAAAGIFFAGYLIALAQTSGDSGLWPVAAGRGAATVAIGLVFLGTRIGNPARGAASERTSSSLSIGAGVLDAAANALYALAVRNGMLSVVAVVASMYPGSTVLLARVFLAEKLTRRRGAGMAVGMGAVAVIAFGSTVTMALPSAPVEFEAPVTPETTTMQPSDPPPQMPLIDFGSEPATVDFETGSQAEPPGTPVPRTEEFVTFE